LNLTVNCENPGYHSKQLFYLPPPHLDVNPPSTALQLVRCVLQLANVKAIIAIANIFFIINSFKD